MSPFTRRLPLLNESFLDLDALAAALPGLANPQAGSLFVRALEHSLAAYAYRRSYASRRGPSAPDADGWHPWTAIATLAEQSRAEATWLAYLTTFFGPDERHADAWQATRVVYGAFGTGTLRWHDLRADASLLTTLCAEHEAAFAALPRGNHRKFEPLAAVHDCGLLASVASLRVLAEASGDIEALFAAGDDPRSRFDRLMREFRVVSFGRTGRFDLLVLLGDLNVCELEPPRLYLQGATGPLTGARRALPGSRSKLQLDWEIARVADEFAIPIAVLEDALCNWQKRL